MPDSRCGRILAISSWPHAAFRRCYVHSQVSPSANFGRLVSVLIPPYRTLWILFNLAVPRRTARSTKAVWTMPLKDRTFKPARMN